MNKKTYKIIFLLLCFSSFANCQFRDADLNQDGIVNNSDLHEMMNLWLCDCYENPCYNIDTNNDGFIDFLDLSKLAKFWRVTNNGSYQVAYWQLDESSGYTAYDVTSGGHNATLKNMTASDHVTGKIGQALDFDGVNDYLEISKLSNGMGQYFTKDFTIALWVYRAQYTGEQQYQTLIGIESTSRYTTYGYEGFTIELDNGVPVMYIADSNEYMETTAANFAFTPFVWQHLCIVRQGGLLKFYLNGALKSTAIINNTNIRFGSIWPGYDVIGETYDSCYGHNALFRGRIDDVHLYNFAIPENLVYKIAKQDYSNNPVPANQSTDISADTGISWQKGRFASAENCHDVYFGTNSTAVLNATTSTPGIYKGRQTSRLYMPGELASETMYYWRIDDVNGASIHKGSVWSFITAGEFSTSSSSWQIGYGSEGAFNNNRFASTINNCWKGLPDQSGWYWQINFNQPTQIGSLLSIMGEPQESAPQLELYQINAPLDYIWQYSSDGINWVDISETQVGLEQRIFRIQRFNSPIIARFLRMSISNCFGLYPVIREVELYTDTNADIYFNNWVVAVDITNEPDGPYGNTQWFIDRARQCRGWENIQGQQLWVLGCNEDFLNVEPYPLCVFLSGSFDEWCQVNREYFAGISGVITNGNIPIWASCGGAQLMGLLAEPGWQNPWDCPRCRQRDHHNPPYSPIYGYIGYLNPAIEPELCGNYENNIYEIGDYLISKVGSDPVFNALENQFYAYEYHCGQLNYLPAGWHQVGGAGSGTLTNMQCFRKDNTLIYGAQFHIENESGYYITNNTSRIIMANFLNLAQQSGGYDPPQ